MHVHAGRRCFGDERRRCDGPLAVEMRNTWSSPVTASACGSADKRSAQPGGTAEKLASMALWLGIEALSFSGESSATRRP